MVIGWKGFGSPLLSISGVFINMLPGSVKISPKPLGYMVFLMRPQLFLKLILNLAFQGKSMDTGDVTCTSSKFAE